MTRTLTAFIAALIAVGAFITPAAAQVVWSVDDRATLDRILPAASAGDILELGPGPWGSVRVEMSGTQDAPLILRPANAEAPPVLTDLSLIGAAHIDVQGLVIRPVSGVPAVDLRASRHITLSDLTITGSGRGTGLTLTEGEQITIDNAAISDLTTGVIARDTRHLTLSNSQVTNLHDRAFQSTGGAWLTLDGNRFTKFRLAPPDATRTFPTVVTLAGSPDHILIKDNLIDIGGAVSRPAVHIGDVFTKTPDAEPIRDLTIAGNVLITAQRDALSIGPVDGAEIRANAVIGSRQPPHNTRDQSESAPQINISARARNVIINGNWAAYWDAVTAWDVRDNIAIQDRYPGQADHYDALFLDPNNPDPLLAFRPNPTGTLAAAAGGPAILRTALAEDPLAVELTSTEPSGPAPLRPRLRYDPTLGQIVALDRAGNARIAQDAVKGTIALGDAFPPVDIPPEMIGPLFSASDFDLTLRLRGRPGYRDGGEVIRMHNWMSLEISDRGSVSLRFRTVETPWKMVTIRNARANNGDWHDVRISFSELDDAVTLTVNDLTPANAITAGVTPPVEFWGLTLGNPFGDRDTWEGEIGAVTLSSRSAP